MKCYGIKLIDSDRIEYVGSTISDDVQDRFGDHLRAARWPEGKRRLLVSWWIRKRLAEGLKVECIELAQVIDKDPLKLEQLEKDLITQYRTWDEASLNISDGGRGPCGEKMSKLAMARAAVPGWKETQSQVQKISQNRPDVRERRIAALRKSMSSPETRILLRKAAEKRWADPLYKERWSISAKANRSTDEARARNSSAQKIAQNKPEIRQRNSEVRKGVALSKPHRDALSKAGKGRPKSDEHKAKIKAGLRKFWDSKKP